MRAKAHPAPKRLTRRQLLQQAGVAGGLLAFPGCRRTPKKHAAGPAGRALSADEWALCTAACERILPEDGDPGATRLGVVDFIDRRLSAPGKRATQGRRRLRHGLALLSKWSQERFGQDFCSLAPEDQDVALASLAAEGGDEGFAFVRSLISLTIEGAFADPSYGGNRDGAGWKLVGFQAPCPNPRCH